MSENDDGFREFFAGCRTELSRAAFFLAGDALAAEDLLQDALVKTAARWDKVKTLAAPEAYVRTIMLNTVRSRWRRRQRIAEHPTDRLADRASGEDLETGVLDRDELARCLRALAPRQRAVLYIRFYLDLSESQTAEMLGCSVGTVKSQTYDALSRLRTTAPGLRGSDLNEVGHD